jgi:hypothetical protein
MQIIEKGLVAFDLHVNCAVDWPNRKSEVRRFDPSGPIVGTCGLSIAAGP